MRLSTLLTYSRGKNLFLPAHGRGNSLPPNLKKLLKNRPGIWDLPELPDIGGPFCSNGAIAISQKNAALAMGVDRCWYGVNGATGLLQAALLSIAKPNQAVLMPRNVHRSIVQACLIGEIIPVFFDLPFLKDRGHFIPPDEIWLNKVLKEDIVSTLDIAGLIVVSPSYHGYSNDLTALIKTAHEKNWPVLVDEAHGAHFAANVDSTLPKSALNSCADLVVHSLHKSSIGLSQTAVLWSQGDLIDPLRIERSVGWLQTSSPNALLLASCEESIFAWRTKAGKKKLLTRLNQAKEIFSSLRLKGMPLLQNQDPLRLILHTGSRGITGFKADECFIKRSIVGELPEPATLTFCLGFSRHRDLIRLMKIEWDYIVENFSEVPFKPFPPSPFPLVSIPKISSSAASRANSEQVCIEDAVGKISSDLICPYPPGIPFLIPGELIDQARADWLLEQRNYYTNQISPSINVVC